MKKKWMTTPDEGPAKEMSTPAMLRERLWQAREEALFETAQHGIEPGRLAVAAGADTALAALGEAQTSGPAVASDGALLVAQQRTHGEFAATAALAQALKSVVRDRAASLPPTQPDHWLDITGYAVLACHDAPSAAHPLSVRSTPRLREIGRRLSLQQVDFVYAYLVMRDPARAAEAVGISTRKANLFLHHPHVAEVIEIIMRQQLPRRRRKRA
jgi:hypothetical protein